MTKRNYYNLLNEYNYLIKAKQYNPTYCAQSDLDNIKNKLLLFIKKSKTNAELDLYNSRHSMYESYTGSELLNSLETMLNLIKDEKIIDDEIYNHTYGYTYMTIHGIPLSIAISFIILVIFTLVFLI